MCDLKHDHEYWSKCLVHGRRQLAVMKDSPEDELFFRNRTLPRERAIAACAEHIRSLEQRIEEIKQKMTA